MKRTAHIRSLEQELRAYKQEERKASKKAHRATVDPVKRERGRVRDGAHLQFIRRLPCVATYVQTGALVYGCDACHVRFADTGHGKLFTGGQRKPDDLWTLPMTRASHERQHSMNERRFYEDLRIDALSLCRALHAVSGDEEAALAIIKELRR